MQEQEQDTTSASDVNLTPHAGAELAKVSIELSSKACDDRCVEDKIKELALELQETGVSTEHQRDLLNEVLDITELKGAEKRALLDQVCNRTQSSGYGAPVVTTTEAVNEESSSILDKLKKLRLQPDQMGQRHTGRLWPGLWLGYGLFYLFCQLE